MSPAKLMAWFREAGDQKPTWLRVTGAVAITAAAMALCWLLRPIFKHGIFAIALGATTLSALLFGTWPAVGATILSAIELLDLFEEPALHWQVPSPQDTMQLVAYLVGAGLIIAIAKAREAALQQKDETNAKLQMAVSSRDRLMAVVSHDLKSPLSAILLSTDVLQMAVGKESRRVARMVDTIRISAQRMDTLIRNLLDLSVLDQGAVSLHRRPMSVTSVLDQAIQLQQPIARDRGITLRSRVPADLPAAQVDCDRLHQVLSNLMDNALKFTPSGGTVQLETRTPSPTELVVCVRDTGPGISVDALPHLFDRYWMARYTSAEGTGLGLSIAKAIVEAHGGRIWAQNNADVGATFCFTLPTAQQVALDRTAA